MIEHLLVRVTNVGKEPLDRVAVTFDSAYVRGFSEVVFTPEVNHAHRVELEQLRPAEVRLISVELKADRYGSSRGEVAVTYGDTRVAVALNTLILP